MSSSQASFPSKDSERKREYPHYRFAVHLGYDFWDKLKDATKENWKQIVSAKLQEKFGKNSPIKFILDNCYDPSNPESDFRKFCAAVRLYLYSSKLATRKEIEDFFDPDSQQHQVIPEEAQKKQKPRSLWSFFCCCTCQDETPQINTSSLEIASPTRKSLTTSRSFH